MKFIQFIYKGNSFSFFFFFSVFLSEKQIEINFEIEVFNKDHCH